MKTIDVVNQEMLANPRLTGKKLALIILRQYPNMNYATIVRHRRKWLEENKHRKPKAKVEAPKARRLEFGKDVPPKQLDYYV